MKYNYIKYILFVFLIPYLAACDADEGKTDIAFVKFFGDGTNDYGIDIILTKEETKLFGEDY